MLNAYADLPQDNLIPEGHNVLIFSQTRKMLNLIQVCNHESLLLRMQYGLVNFLIFHKCS
jgi:SNF2 family DNA or RNA helicase